MKRYTQETGGDMVEYEQGEWVKFNEVDAFVQPSDGLAISLFAVALSECESVPADIGIKLATVVYAHQSHALHL